MKNVITLAFLAVSMTAKIDFSKGNFSHIAIDLESSTTSVKKTDAIQHGVVKDAKSKAYHIVGKFISTNEASSSHETRLTTTEYKASSSVDEYPFKANPAKNRNSKKVKESAAAMSSKYPQANQHAKSKAYSSSIGKNNWSIKAYVSKSPKVKTGNKWSLKYSPSNKNYSTKAKGIAGPKSTKYPKTIIHAAKSKAYGKSSWSTTNPQAPKSKKAGNKITLKAGHGNKGKSPLNKGKDFKSTKHPKFDHCGKTKGGMLNGPNGKKNGKKSQCSPTSNPTQAPDGGRGPPMPDTETLSPSTSPSSNPSFGPSGLPSYAPKRHSSSKKTNKYPTKSSPSKPEYHHPWSKGKAHPATLPQVNNGPSKGGGNYSNPTAAPAVSANNGPGRTPHSNSTKGVTTTTKYTKSPGSSAYTFPKTSSVAVNSKEKKAHMARNAHVLASEGK